MDSLSELEHRSIFILREAYRAFPRMCMLWSIGKDSTVMVWLARKAFFGHVPFPLLHIDTNFKIPEMIAYRDRFAAQWGLDLRVAMNEEALQAKQTFPDGNVDRISCCGSLKTRALREAIQGTRPRYIFDHSTKTFVLEERSHAFDGVIVGLRADEEGTRSKERYFSPRDFENQWDISAQPPEFWSQFNTEFPSGTHVRIHPLLDWTELSIWRYIAREKIPTVDLYYDQGSGTRYRSLGCAPCTQPIKSNASSPDEIVQELSTGALVNIAERSGRAQDKDDGGGLERLRRDGYM